MERKKGYEYIRLDKSMKIILYYYTITITIHSLGLIIVIS